MFEFLKTLLYEPLYNALVYLIGIVPGGDVGLAVILLTLAVKFILLPVAHKTIRSQAMMKAIEPEVKDLRAKKLDKQQEAVEVMEIYKKNGVNPFSGCLLLLIQLPIIITLFLVFRYGLPVIDGSVLYSFVPYPETINTLFLGFFELKEGSIILAALAGLTQFAQMKVSLPSTGSHTEKKSGEKPTFQEEFTKNMTTQMKYILPIFITIAAYTLSAAIALYWITNNVFTTIHELLVRKKKQEIRGD